MAKPEAFIALEQTMAAAMQREWGRKTVKAFSALYVLLEQEKWGDAHALVDQISLNGLIGNTREQMEELSVSAILFGAHHVAGSVKSTSFARGEQELPYAMRQALDQLSIMMEANAADDLRAHLHEIITELDLADDKTPMSKEDMAAADLENGGALNPEQRGFKKKNLYVHRPLINAVQLIAWAKEQGFKSTLPEYDLHVTVCFSRDQLVWSKAGVSDTEVIVKGGERRIEQFGEATVLTFESSELRQRHQEFRDAGASSDFATYRAHVTLTYDAESIDLSKVEPFAGELVFGPEVFAELSEGWADDLIESKIEKAELTLAQRLNDAVLRGKKLVDTGANLTTSRLVSLGFLAEAIDKNVTTYQVSEVLDSRTCAVCRMMHGKTFNVEQEYSRVVTAIGTMDPKELKSIAPWPSNTKAGLEALREMSVDEMQVAGLGSPPYHPGCRGMLVLVGTVTEQTPMRETQPEVDLGLVPIVSTPASVMATFERLQTTTKWPKYSKRDVAIIDQYTGNSHFSMNSALRHGYGQDKDMRKHLKARIAEMDKAVAKAVLPETVVMYRGVSSAQALFKDADLSKAVGREFTDLGFVSTTASLDYVADIAGANGVVFEITIPAKTKISIPESVEGVLVTAEHEIILERGLRFKITSVDLSGEAPRVSVIVVGKAQKDDGVHTDVLSKEEASRFVWYAGDIILHD